jgi:hypothetical protein
VVASVNWTVPAAPRGATFARRITGMPWKARFGTTLTVVVVVVPVGALTT